MGIRLCGRTNLEEYVQNSDPRGKLTSPRGNFASHGGNTTPGNILQFWARPGPRTPRERYETTPGSPDSYGESAPGTILPFGRARARAHTETKKPQKSHRDKKATVGRSPRVVFCKRPPLHNRRMAATTCWRSTKLRCKPSTGGNTCGFVFVSPKTATMQYIAIAPMIC